MIFPSSIQGGEKVGLLLWVPKTQILFLYCYLLIVVVFSTRTTVTYYIPSWILELHILSLFLEEVEVWVVQVSDCL